MTDRLVDLHAQAMAQEAMCGDTALSADANDTAYQHLRALQCDAFRLRASTPAGALASLEWARSQFAANYLDNPAEADWHDEFVLGLSALPTSKTLFSISGAISL